MRFFLLVGLPAVALCTGGVANIMGAPAKVDELTDEHRHMVDFAVTHLTSNAAEILGAKPTCPIENFAVENFTQQPVAGTLYKFDLVLQKHDPAANCQVAGVDRTCTIKVWDRPWLNKTEVTQTECSGEDETESDEDSDEEDNDADSSSVESNEDSHNPPLLRVGLTKSNVHQGVVSRPLAKGLMKTNSKESVDHSAHLLGGGDHDYLPHGRRQLGQDSHDYLPHGAGRAGGLTATVQLGGKSGQVDDATKRPTDANMLSNQKMWKKLPNKQKSVRRLSEMQSLDSFHRFMNVHSKTYATREEYKKRYGIFRANMKKVQFLEETELGTATYGATRMADLTEQEFRQRHLGLNMSKDDPDIHWPPADIPEVDLPREFDWREHGAVTPVKNQGMCGSCWAFSVTGNVEGQYAIKNKKLVSLSEQELVDCDKRDAGCNGGLPENAYKTLLEIGGLESEADYGYDGADEKCKYNRTKVVARVEGGVEISQNETKMAQWLLKNGPISVGLNANAMQFYMGGVSHPWSFLCSPDGIDHGVLIVGFGIHEYPLFHRKMPYWIIKNSWGPSWGEQGYYRLYRGDGTCGINMMTSSAVLEE